MSSRKKNSEGVELVDTKIQRERCLQRVSTVGRSVDGPANRHLTRKRTSRVA